MNRYEGLFIVDNATAMNDWDNLIEHIQGILAKHNGEVIELKKWEERKLAYKIGEHTRGTYIIMHFNAPAGSVLTMRKEYELSDKIIRVLVVNNDDPKKRMDINPIEESQADESKSDSVPADNGEATPVDVSGDENANAEKSEPVNAAVDEKVESDV